MDTTIEIQDGAVYEKVKVSDNVDQYISDKSAQIANIKNQIINLQNQLTLLESNVDTAKNVK